MRPYNESLHLNNHFGKSFVWIDISNTGTKNSYLFESQKSLHHRASEDYLESTLHYLSKQLWLFLYHYCSLSHISFNVSLSTGMDIIVDIRFHILNPALSYAM